MVVSIFRTVRCPWTFSRSVSGKWKIGQKRNLALLFGTGGYLLFSNDFPTGKTSPPWPSISSFFNGSSNDLRSYEEFGNYPSWVHPHDPPMVSSGPSNDGTSLRNALIGTNIFVYLLWKYFSRQETSVVLFFRHFVASYPNWLAGRWHSFILSSLTHITLGHLLVNCLGLYVFLGDSCLGRDLTTRETLGVLFGAGALAALTQVLYSKQNVIGASGGLMALLVLEGFIHPLQRFMLLLPLPGLTLTASQITQFVVLLNVIGLMFLKRKTRVAWGGHLSGMAAGAAYAAFCYLNNDERFPYPVFPTFKDTIRDWKWSCMDFWLAARLKWLDFRMNRAIHDPAAWADIRADIDTLRHQRQNLATKATVTRK